MSEIKVGQVWETTNKYKVVVTSVEEEYQNNIQKTIQELKQDD